jgi:hypothetical protein
MYRKERGIAMNEVYTMVRSSRPAQPPEESFVVTKCQDDLSDGDFCSRVAALKQLQEQAAGASAAAAVALVRYAVEYAALYAHVERNGSRVAELNRALGLPERAATRLRIIASEANELTKIEAALPPTLEQMYEITLAVKDNPDKVRQAVSNGLLRPDSPCKHIQMIRGLMSLGTGSKRRRKGSGLPRGQRKGSMSPGQQLIGTLRLLVERDSTVWFQHKIHVGTGTTMIGTFIITNVKPDDDDRLPDDLDPCYARAVRFAIRSQQ